MAKDYYVNNRANIQKERELVFSMFDEYASEQPALRGLASCKVTKVLGEEHNNLSQQISCALKSTRVAPQTNRETFLDATLPPNDEHRYCRKQFSDIINLIISFAVDKKLARNSPALESPENEEECNGTIKSYSDDIVDTLHEKSSLSSDAATQNPPSCSSEEVLNERALFIGDFGTETDSSIRGLVGDGMDPEKSEEMDLARSLVSGGKNSGNSVLNAPLQVHLTKKNAEGCTRRKFSTSYNRTSANVEKNSKDKNILKVLTSRHAPVSDKKYLSVPQSTYLPKTASPDDFKLSPVLANGRPSNGHPSCKHLAASTSSVYATLPMVNHKKYHCCGKSPRCGNRHERRHFVNSSATDPKKQSKCDMQLAESALVKSPISSYDKHNQHQGLLSSILSRVPYKYDTMVLIWCKKGMSRSRISQLLYGNPDSNCVQCKSVSIVAWDEDIYLPPGFVLKFQSAAEAARAHRELLHKYRVHVQSLAMNDLITAVANIECSNLNVRPSTIFIRSKKRQDQSPDTRDLELCFQKYGDVMSVVYSKKEAGAELVCEVKYSCVTQGFLAVVALDGSHMKNIGSLFVKFKRNGINEILVPKIKDYIQKCLKNT